MKVVGNPADDSKRQNATATKQATYGGGRKCLLLLITGFSCRSLLPKLLPLAPNGAPTDLASNSASLVSLLN